MSKNIRDYLNVCSRNDANSDSIFHNLSAAERAEARELGSASDTMVMEVPRIVLCDLDEILASV